MRLESVDEIINDDIFLKFKAFTCGIDVFVKVEGMNAGGSIKMKTAKALINDAIEEKGLLKSKRFIESSSGNLGLSLSIIAAARGLHFTCVVDKNTSTQNVKMMRALGTEVIIIEHKDAQGGYLGNRLAYIRSAIEKDPALIWLNQYKNMANPTVHAEMTAKSILAEFGKVDYLFIGAGTTGTLMGCARFFRRYSPETTLIAVDSIGSITFGTPGAIRHLPGLGSSVQPHFFDETQIDLLIQIHEAETVATCRDIARRFGYLGGASTGTILAAVKRLHKDIAGGANVVAISPDMGSGYVDTVYNDEWCYRTFGDSWKIQEKNSNMEGIGYV